MHEDGKLISWLEDRRDDLAWKLHLAAHRNEYDKHDIRLEVTALGQRIEMISSDSVDNIINKRHFVSCHLFT